MTEIKALQLKKSSAVLNEDLCCLFTNILAGYQPCVAHVKVYFTSSLSMGMVERSHF